MLETLDFLFLYRQYTNFLYFDLYLNTAHEAGLYVYMYTVYTLLFLHMNFYSKCFL